MATNNSINASDPASVSDGGTGVGTLTTAYGVLCSGTTATGPIQALASLGALGTVLTSNGPGVFPGFQAAGSGGGSLVFISSQTASSSSTVNFTGLNSTYDVYMIQFSKVKCATNGVSLYARVGAGGGPTYQSGASDYGYSVFYHNINGTYSQTQSISSSFMQISSGNLIDNTTTYSASGSFFIYAPSSTSEYKNFLSSIMHRGQNFAGFSVCTSGGVYNSTTAITAVQFLMSSGNISSGVFKLYGIRNS